MNFRTTPATYRSNISIIKFGCDSISSAPALNMVLSIIKINLMLPSKLLIVCSALKGVTEMLLECINLATANKDSYLDILDSIRKKHVDLICQTIDETKCDSIISNIDDIIYKLKELLYKVHSSTHASSMDKDHISSFAELLSATVVSGHFNAYNINAKVADAKSFIVSDENFGNAAIKFEATQKKVLSWYESLQYTPIITGRVASSINGATTTLGFHGADYTTITMGSVLGADLVQIWSTSNGIINADSNYVTNPFSVTHITYLEILEVIKLNDSNILHAPSIHLAMSKGIPILIKNTFNHVHPGTLISMHTALSTSNVRAIGTVKNVTLLEVQYSDNDTTLAQNTTTAIIESLNAKNITVLTRLYSVQNNSLLVCIRQSESEFAIEAMQKKLSNTTHASNIKKMNIKSGFSLVAAIGEIVKQNINFHNIVTTILHDNNITPIFVVQHLGSLSVATIVTHNDFQIAACKLHENLCPLENNSTFS